MTKYRIVEITRYQNTPKESKKYIIQTRLFGFLWWYDYYMDDYFDSLDDAIAQVNLILKRDIKRVVWEK